MLGVKSPDRLWEELTFGEWLGWCKAHNQQPFGEARNDFRMAAVALSIMAVLSGGGDAPDLIHPYFRTAEDNVPEALNLLEQLKDPNGALARKISDLSRARRYRASEGQQARGDSTGQC